MRPRLLDLCGCEGGAAAGYQAAGWHVTSVDLDAAALRRNPADETVVGDALEFLAKYGTDFDAIHASFPCQRWSANGANPNASKWPDLITPGRELLNATGKPWVMENVIKAPLRKDFILCGSMFGLGAEDADGERLVLRRHRVFESSLPELGEYAPVCNHKVEGRVAGVYGGARSDKHEARNIRKGGYVPSDPLIQSALLGHVPWMTGKGRRECIPPAYTRWIGHQLKFLLDLYPKD